MKQKNAYNLSIFKTVVCFISLSTNELCIFTIPYHRVVTVRTQGTSDDDNHDKLDTTSVYLKISSDTRTIASYYSIDKKKWHMVRL